MRLTSPSGFYPQPVLFKLAVCISLSLASPQLFAQSDSSILQSRNQTASISLQAASAIAQKDLAQFIQHTVQSRSAGLPIGFPLEVNDVQDLKDAKIAYGFPVYTITPADILAGRSELRSLAKPTGIWRFLITLHDQPIGMATVEQVDGKWETSAYGAAVLAKDVDAAMGFHANGSRSNVRFIRVYQAQSDFLEVSGQDGQARFAPLHSARQSLLLQQRENKGAALASASDGLLNASELLEPLRAAVRKNMDAMR
ncbi:hypothetical protein HSX11_30005 [Oxalobacteraceae bacterium]|nr:hypothetical protein [Oxalobacteraceae bacterium]